MSFIDYIRKVDVTKFIGNPNNLAGEIRKANRIDDRIGGVDIDSNMRKYIDVPRETVFMFPGLFKADMEAHICLISFGHPIVENILFFTQDSNSHLTLDEMDDLETVSSFAIRLMDMKYSYEPTFYSALPFSFLQCTGFRNNIITYYSRILKQLLPKPKGEIFNIPYGFIIHHLGGIFEDMIGLIPLLERNMIKLGVDKSSRQPMFELNMNDKLTKEIWGSLEAYATGSRLLGRLVTRGLVWDPKISAFFTLYPFPRGSGFFEDLAKEKGLEIEHMDINDPLRYMPRIAILRESKGDWDDDDERLYRILYRDELYRKMLDPALKEELNRVIERYLNKDEIDYLINAKYDLKDVLRSFMEMSGKKATDKQVETLWREEGEDLKEWKKKMSRKHPELRESIQAITLNDYLYELIDPTFYPVCRKKHMIILKSVLKDAEELYRSYWDKVREVKDLIDDRSPSRRLNNNEKRLILSSIGLSYLYLSMIYYPEKYSPLLMAEAGYLFKYLTYNGFKGFKWRDAIKYGASLMPRGFIKSYKRPKFRTGIFQRRREKEETNYKFDWMRYERHVDEAKKNLDNFDKFKQLYYLERALQAYEDARKVLYDMLNRYSNEDKKSEITMKLTLLTPQIEDVEKMIKELKKEGYSLY